MEFAPAKAGSAEARRLAGPARSGWPAGRIITAVLLFIYVSWLAFDWLPFDHSVAGSILAMPINLIAALATWLASRRAGSAGRAHAWALVSLAIAFQAAGALAQIGYELADAAETYPSLADPLYLAFYPLLLYGILAFPKRRRARRDRLRLLLDCSIVALSGAAAFAYFAIGSEALEGTTLLEASVTVAYPVGDMILVAAIAAAAMAVPTAAVRSSLRWIAAAITFFVLGDFAWGSFVLVGGYEGGSFLELAYMLAFVCFVIAADHERGNAGAAADSETTEEGGAAWLPYVAIGVALTVLLIDEFDTPSYPDAAVTTIAAGVVMMLLGRQLLSLAEVRRSRAQLAQAQALAGIGSFAWDVVDDRVEFSAEGARMLEVQPGEALSIDDINAMIHPEDLPTHERMIEQALIDGKPFSYEARLRRRDGEVRTFQVRTQIEVRDGVVVEMHGTHQDVTEQRRMETLLEYQASHDPLTGLYNRRQFTEELERALLSTQRYRRPGAVLMLDVDDFKSINDSLGHGAGDATLKAVGAALSSRARETDTVARLGGDEFALVLPEVHPDRARQLAEDIRAVVAESSGAPHLSIGIATFAGEDQVAEDVLVAADLALYEAKESGKNQVRVYNGQTNGARSWVERIRAALREERFVLYAQPMIELKTDQVSHHELLIRMISEQGDLVPPAEFLPTAERVGLITEIDRWVTRQGLSLAQGGQRVSINLAAPSIGDPEILRTVREAIDGGLSPEALIFEITETAAMTNMETARDFVTCLSELGCGVALDDFGTGFGSFAYLKHLPTTYLKIDREFVADVAENPTDREVVRSITEVAHTLGKRTVAEGVEDADTLAALRSYGVDWAQGYYLGRPERISPPTPTELARERWSPAKPDGAVN